MTSALMPSRRKMCAKAFITVVVPAPEEPVTAMTGWRADMVTATRSGARFGPEQRAFVEQRRGIRSVGAAVELGVIALDALDFVARAEDHRDALVQCFGLHIQQPAAAGRGGGR